MRGWSWLSTCCGDAGPRGGHSAPSSEGQVEGCEQHEREACGSDDVPRPWAHHVKEAVNAWRVPEIHVVAAGQKVGARVGRGQSQREPDDPAYRPASRRDPQADHQEQGRGDDGPVRDVELEEEITGKVVGEVWGDEAVGGAGQPPEIGQLDQQRTLRPQGCSSHKCGDVTEMKRKRIAEGPGVLQTQPYPPA